MIFNGMGTQNSVFYIQIQFLACVQPTLVMQPTLVVKTMLPPPTPPSPPPGRCHHHHTESWLDIDSVCRFDTRSPTLLIPSAQSSKLKLTSLTTIPISLSLKNQGSVARDHLSSERTFLAYVRTSLAIASTGVGTSLSDLDPSHLLICLLALVQLFTLSTSNLNAAAQIYARPLGGLTIMLGICVLLIGAFAKFYERQTIDNVCRYIPVLYHPNRTRQRFVPDRPRYRISHCSFYGYARHCRVCYSPSWETIIRPLSNASHVVVDMWIGEGDYANIVGICC
jgi:uncharacterized membrane protein YidH (DUF202 family)